MQVVVTSMDGQVANRVTVNVRQDRSGPDKTLLRNLVNGSTFSANSAYRNVFLQVFNVPAGVPVTIHFYYV